MGLAEFDPRAEGRLNKREEIEEIQLAAFDIGSSINLSDC